jgi:hypothetical protein
VSLRKGLIAFVLAAVTAMAADQVLPTPYDLIRPVWPLTWDSTIFNTNFTAGPKRNSLPDINTPAAYSPNNIIPDSLNQAFIDAMLIQMSPIRVNQAGYRPQDPQKYVLYVGSATDFEVVNEKGEVVGNGSFSETLSNSVSSSLTIRASNNAQTTDGGDTRYTTTRKGPSGALKRGSLPHGLPENERLRIKVGDEYSSTFIISDRVYSMLRDAVLKFYGINRSGNSESWFHPPSHVKDGSLANVDMTGGWYDCGDHLKEAQTISYSLAQLAVTAAAFEDRDQDNYAFNQSEINNTDDVPDILREAKFGAEYVIKAYDAAKGVVSAMPVSVGNIGKDHGWWGSPEFQDNALHDRGGPTSRILRSDDHPAEDSGLELGSTASGNFAAGLAIVSKIWNRYDSTFAKKSLTVAKALYDYGKAKKSLTNTAAYSGGSEYNDEMGFAAICLFYATADKTYLNDAVEEKSLAGGQTKKDFASGDKKGAGMFNGGWFEHKNPSFLKNNAASDWASVFTSGLYAFYKLILETKEKASAYGLSDEQRMIYIEDVAFTMAANLAGVMTGEKRIIDLPAGQASWVGSSVSYDPVWGITRSVNPEQWWTKYEAANIFELLAYYDVTKDLENVTMPQTGTIQNWKSDEILNLAVSHMNYFLGMNPWDVSLVYGVGDKNHAHPHHRGSNPEGKNVAGLVSSYKYRPPVGGLGPGLPPSTENDLSVHFNNWQLTENTCIDAVSNLLPATVILAKSENLNRAPSIIVEKRHVSMDSAIYVVKLDIGGNVYISLDTTESIKNPSVVASETGKKQHEIVLRDLQPGTTYYFYVTAANSRSGNTTKKWAVDSTMTPFSFTTLGMVEDANIQNVTVCNVTADSAEIMWYTPNGEYESKVYWDTIPHTDTKDYAFNTGTGNADISGGPTMFHYVKIGGLKERTTYYYAVESNGAYTNVNENNQPLKFKTPVMQYNFEVRMSQYVWDPMPGLEINVYNNEVRPFDSLTIRLYMRATDEIYYDVGIRRDICQAYNESAFNDTCSQETQRELDGLFRQTFPKKIDDTYDPTDGTWQWYFPIPLGSTIIKSTSRLRIDVLFDRRSEWEPHLDLMNDTPKKKFYCKDHGDTWESQAGDKLAQNPGDWSWQPHSKANGDYADYEGLPCEKKDFGDDDLAPINPYVSVYRKDEFVWGYSPSKAEMATKRADYKLDVAFDAPFNVSNGSHVEVNQVSKTMYVKGNAHITEGGFITQIWANGERIPLEYSVVDNESYMSYNDTVVAHYNLATDLWDLNIPVKMKVGSNKVDITVFAGPDPECDECRENGGCAFENRNYYVEFNRPNMTDGVLAVKDENGNVVGNNGVVDPSSNQKFYIYLTDKDKAKTKSPITVNVINGKKQDTLKVKMESIGEGLFRSVELITAVSTSKEKRGANEISFFPGDTIYVEYQDPEDEEDYSRITAFYAESNYPMPKQVVAQDSDCDNVADKLTVVFSNILDENYSFDSIRVFLEGMNDTVTLSVPQPVLGLDKVSIPLDGIGVPATAAPSGTASVFITTRGETARENVKIVDGIAPQLLSVTILENLAPRTPEDTLMIAFTEPVLLASPGSWPLTIEGVSGDRISVLGQATPSNGGKNWLFVVTGNDGGSYIPVGGIASIKSGMNITDESFNELNPASPCAQGVKIAETPKPVPITLAEMRDNEGDGYVDELYLKFERKLRPQDMLDSFVVEWGMKNIVKSFFPADWKHTVSVADNPSLANDSISIITISFTTSNGFPYGTTSGSYDGYGHVTPRLGPEGGFFDKFYYVVDKCPPIIMRASKKSLRGIEMLEATMSEPLTTIDNPALEYVERMRGSQDGVYLKPEFVRTNNEVNVTYSYSEDAEGAVRVSDFIRLVPLASLSRYKDNAGNFPTGQNPWVLVDGAFEKTNFRVTLANKVTKFPNEEPYMGTPVSDDEVFRATIINMDGTESLMSLDGGKLSATGIVLNTGVYKHAGPQFIVEITMPSALQTDDQGNPLFDFEIKFTMNVFDNIGQFIAKQDVRIDMKDIGYDKISNDGVLRVNMEWMAHNGAPKSNRGRAIGTGAYIAKFDFESKATYVSAVETAKDNGSAYKQGDVIKTTDDAIKTFGFKRSRRK